MIPEPLILPGNCLDILREIDDDSIDAIVTDPPYGLSNTDPAHVVEAITQWASGNREFVPHKRGGFMGKEWDSFVPPPAVWDECLRVLKPGGHLLTFAGTRTMDLMTLGLRLAGFDIRDSVAWLYGCLTADAEVLTAEGWRPGTEVAVGDSVMQWDPATGAMSLTPVQEKFLAPWDGPMRVLRNADTDQVLTPNHRVHHRTWDRTSIQGVRTGQWSDWKVSEAADVTGMRVQLPVAGEHDGPGIGGEDYAALLGWVWTEGGFDHSGSGVRAYQSSVNPAKCDQIDALLGRLGSVGRYARYDYPRTYARRSGEEHRYVATTWYFTGDLATRVRADLPGKRPTYDLLWRMSLAEKRAFLDAAMLGDGSGWDGTSPQFYQKHEDDLVWFQTLLSTVGMSGKVAMRPDRDNGSVYLRRRGTTELQARHLADREEHYTGDVWCVRVPTGAFVARRNGKVFITGNSGFPKSMDVSKAIDKAGGASPEVQSRVLSRARKRSGLSREEVAAHVGCTTSSVRDWEEGRARATGRAVEFITPSPAYREALADLLGYTTDERAIVGARLDRRGDGTVIGLGHSGVEYGGPATDAAQQWTGWGTALKPAFEPIVMARKPLTGTVAANVLEHGTGALNIDATRVGQPDGFGGGAKGAGGNSVYGDLGGYEAGDGFTASTQGRWPANVILGHTEDCEPSGTRKVKSGTAVNRNRGDERPMDVAGAPRKVGAKVDVTYAGADGMETIEAWNCAPGCQVAELDAQSGTSSSKAAAKSRPMQRQDNEVYGKGLGSIGPENTYSDSGGASRFFYCSKAPKRERPVIVDEDGTRTVHPTVKPLALMRWLIRLVTPPGGVILDPFVGSGTTIEAGMLEGFEVWGIEGEEDYLPLIQQRVDRVMEAAS